MVPQNHGFQDENRLILDDVGYPGTPMWAPYDLQLHNQSLKSWWQQQNRPVVVDFQVINGTCSKRRCFCWTMEMDGMRINKKWPTHIFFRRAKNHRFRYSFSQESQFMVGKSPKFIQTIKQYLSTPFTLCETFTVCYWTWPFMATEIVDLPIKKWWFSSSLFVNVYQRVISQPLPWSPSTRLSIYQPLSPVFIITLMYYPLVI